MTIPDRLREIVASVEHPDDLVQGPIVWRPKSWARGFSRVSGGLWSHDYAAAIAELARTTQPAQEDAFPRIGRNTVLTLCAPGVLGTTGGRTNETSVMTAFLATMIWGYGLTNVGPYRTARVLTRDSTTCDEETIAQLVAVTEIAQSEGGVAAFDHVATQRRSGSAYLKFLGPAFGTKFLYFLTKASSVRTTPVLDSVVHGWLRKHAPEVGSFTLSWRDTSSYESYVDLLHSWATELPPAGGRSLDADDLEFLMFNDARRGSPLLAEPENVTVESMLDDLGAEADARGGKSDMVGALLVEALREWFAERPQSDV